jgi:hypothetical protein
LSPAPLNAASEPADMPRGDTCPPGGDDPAT